MKITFGACALLLSTLHAEDSQELHKKEAPIKNNPPSKYCNENDSLFGYDEGLFFQPKGDLFSLKINGLTQNRFVFDHRKGTPTSSPFNTSYGFENTRNALNFSGYLSKAAFYNLRLELGAYTSGLIVDWGYGGMSFHPGINFSLGVMRIPTLREWIIPDEYQLAISRSYTTAPFDVKTTALQLGYEGSSWRINAYAGSGLPKNTNSTHFTTEPDDKPHSYVSNNNTWMGALRLEWLALQTASEGCITGSGPDTCGRLSSGRWAPFTQFTGNPKKPQGLLLGAFASYTHLRAINHALEEEEYNDSFWQITADLQMQFKRGSLYAAIWAIPEHGNALNTHGDTAYGGIFQGSIYATKKLEFFARYETANWQEDAFLSMTRFSTKYSSIGTLGFNYYILGQNLKLSADAGFSGKPLKNNLLFSQAKATDWLNDFSTEGGQILARLQLQAFF